MRKQPSSMQQVCNCLKHLNHNLSNNNKLEKLYNPVFYNRCNMDVNGNNGRAAVSNRTWRLHSGNILQYYYNNALNKNNMAVNNNVNSDIIKKSNINIINNIFAISNQELNKNYEKNNIHQYFETQNISKQSQGVGDNQNKSNLQNDNNQPVPSDSQQRPLVLNFNQQKLALCKKLTVNAADTNLEPNFKIIPNKSGLKISPIYTISESIEKTPIKTKITTVNQTLLTSPSSSSSIFLSSYFRNTYQKTTAVVTKPLYLQT